MSEQPPKNEEVVTVPPKAPKKSNKVAWIVIGSILGLLVVGGLIAIAIGWFVYDKAGDTIKDAVEQAQLQTDQDNETDDDYDRFAADDTDYTDEQGGRTYATKHGLPSNFPKEVTIVQPSELKQISSQAPAKGEAPTRWRVISETEYETAEATKAAIEKAYQGFGKKIDRTNRPGAEQFAKDNVMLSYTNDDYRVDMIAAQETEYQKGPVGNFLITYNIEIRQ